MNIGELLEHFPNNGLFSLFGYGSKVIKQIVNSDSDLVDLVFVVNNPLEWHKNNLVKNRHHYSSVKYFPQAANKITILQENYGGQIYYNPYVRVGGINLKYGVIKTQHLLQDLNEWTSLYVAGRLHKPVNFVINSLNKEVLQQNLRYALIVALLILPESFDKLTLYKTIASLSYQGDIRMMFAEDKNKVDNIVRAQMSRFNELYLPIINENDFKTRLHCAETRGSYVQDLSPGSILWYLKGSPRNLKETLCYNHKNFEVDEVLHTISTDLNHDLIVRRALSSIVLRSSLSQTVKGLVTAGALKSVIYAQRKVKKFFVSKLYHLKSAL